MIVLTNSLNNLILYIFPDSVKMTNDIKHTLIECVDFNICFKYGRTDPVNIYKNVTVPEEVKPQAYFYDGVNFTINPDYSEPDPIPYPS